MIFQAQMVIEIRVVRVALEVVGLPTSLPTFYNLCYTDIPLRIRDETEDI